MDLKTIIFSLGVFIVFGTYAWINPIALDYKFALLIISALLIIWGFISRQALTDFVKQKANSVVDLMNKSKSPTE